MLNDNEQRVAARLITEGQQILDDGKVDLITFADDETADTLINDIDRHPHAYVIACIMDRQIKAERAWRIPYELSQRLGTFEFDELDRLSEMQIQKAMTEPTPLHRFPNEMTKNIRFALDHIKREYRGDARLIWKDTPSSATVIYRFLQFRGVGQKIATMAANLLTRYFKVPFSDYYSIDISVDVQIRRVMGRLGIVAEGASPEDIIFKARSLNPEYPGIIDSPLWYIGRDWCRPKKPTCSECYMNRLCPTSIRQ